MRVRAALRTFSPAPLAFAPARRPPCGRASLLSASTRQGARGRQRRGRCPDFLPPSPPPRRQEKFSRRGQACPLHPGGAGSAAPGPAAPTWRRDGGPAPTAPPPPPPTEPLPAAAEAGPGYTPGAGTHGSGRSFLRALVRPPASPAPRRPFLYPLGPGLRREGAGGGRWRRAEEEKESEGRTVPGEKPVPAAAASPLPTSSLANAEMAAAAAKGNAGSPAPLCAPAPPATNRRQPRRSGLWVDRRPQTRSRAGGWPRPLPTLRHEGAGSGAPNHNAPPAGPAPRPPSRASAVGRPQRAFVTCEGVLLELWP
ncbi:uncharacterized protein LOC141575530 [Camelus bactrianus]|uniref:Uncharacterized protein LOC141575530 n=1 Tax=Camelus bactrianus TaxID=9837 RepID=A0AC58PLW6_CAMBA